MNYRTGLFWLIPAAFVGLRFVVLAADLKVQQAFSANDLDVDSCIAFVDGKEGNRPTKQQLLGSFGLDVSDERNVWSAGDISGKRSDFIVVFKAPVEVGSVIAPSFSGPARRLLQTPHGRFVAIPRGGQEDVPRVLDDDRWEILPGGVVKTLKHAVKIRAMRFTSIATEIRPAREHGAESRMAPVLVLRERVYDPLVMGSQCSYGNAKENRPEYWIQNWREPRHIAAIGVWYSSEAEIAVTALPPSVQHSPVLARHGEWIRLGSGRLRPGAQILSLAGQNAVTALKISGPEKWRVERDGALIPFCPLNEGELPPSAESPQSPFKISYEMPYDGIVAFHIYEKGAGRLVRRLYSETAKAAGPVLDGWDLKDDDGRYVAPGKYEWKAFVRPPFKLTYELTAYNAGQPPWWAPPPAKGGGGWLGDHGTPNCATANGDLMWFGTMCAENGHVAIATDLEGNKVWGTHHVGYGFRGPMYIAADEGAAYLMLQEQIVRVVPSRDFHMRTVFTTEPSEDYPWMPQGYDVTKGGAAASDGKIYWAICAPPEDWLKSSFPSDEIDPANCLPGVGLFKGKGRRADNDKNYGEFEYDELMQLYATFLTEKTPARTATLPNVTLPSSTQASFGNAPSSGEFAGSVVVVFREPVSVGSVLIPDAGIKVYALKEGLDPKEALKPKSDVEISDEKLDKDILEDVAEAMEEMDESGTADDKWVRLFCDQASGTPGIALAPKGGLKTRALRYKVKRLTYSQVVRRRFDNVAHLAKIAFTEGSKTKGNGWLVKRPEDRMLSSVSPAVGALVWNEPVALRGISLSFPIFEEIRVDLWNGDGDPSQSLDKNECWREAGVLLPEPPFRGYVTQTPTCRHVDFGSVITNRAVRIRILAGPKEGSGFEGIVAWRPLGEDAKDLPICMNERIAVIQMPPLHDDNSSAKVIQNIPIPKPGGVAFDAKGNLFCLSDGRIIRVPLDGKGEAQVLVEKGYLKNPVGLAIDAQGFFYVTDLATCVITVFDPATGKPCRNIGSGRQRSGKWDPARLDMPTQVAVDKLGRIWVADASYQPKRIQRFTAKGIPDKCFLGPTQYGGGGWLDHKDKSKIYYNGMRFIIDWPTREWKLDSLIYRPEELTALAGNVMPERPVYYRGRRYLVGPARSGDGYGWRDSISIICEERGDIAVPLAAAGRLSDWDDIDRRDDLRRKFGALDRSSYTFVWSDRNGDYMPQAEEVDVQKMHGGRLRGGWFVGEDLAFITPGYRLRPVSFLDNGVPLYDLSKFERFSTFTRGPGARTENVWGTEDGRIFMIGTRLISADGKNMLWEYFNEFACHEGYYLSRFGYDRPAGVLNQEHKPIGHFRLGDEEYFVTNTDQGDLYCYTADGFFVGCIFGGPAGYGLRRWTMPEWEPGKVDLSDVRLPQEHYQGCVVSTDDGTVYAVAGHNFMGIVRIEGMERRRRLDGSITVSAADLLAAREWEVTRATEMTRRQESKGMRIPFVKRRLDIDGSLTSWPQDIFVTIHEKWVGSLAFGQVLAEYAKGALAYNDDFLYVAAKVSDNSPMKNTSTDPIHVFKGGDAVDVTLGLDPNADPSRIASVAGDLRLVFSVVRGKPVAVLYKPVSPDAPLQYQAKFESPVGSTFLDEVRTIPEAQVAVGEGRGLKDEIFWTLTAAVPWKAIGAKPPPPEAIVRGDIGILYSDDNGVLTMSRRYWSAKSQTVVCDVPSETRLVPALWGEMIFEADKSLSDEGILGEDRGDDFIPATPELDLK